MHEASASADHCPFCGQPDVFVEFIENDGGGRPLYYVVCRDCNCTGPWAIGEEVAIAVWRSRPEYPLEHFPSDGWDPKPNQQLRKGQVRLRNCESCPFCGHQEVTYFGEGHSAVTPICSCCGTTGPDGHTAEEATQLWNRRFKNPRQKLRFDGPVQTN